MVMLKQINVEFKKTKYLVFQPRQKRNYNLHLTLKLADRYLQQSSSVKYLGLIIDCLLSWHDHIDYVSVIAKLKPNVTSQSLTRS